MATTCEGTFTVTMTDLAAFDEYVAQMSAREDCTVVTVDRDSNPKTVTFTYWSSTED